MDLMRPAMAWRKALEESFADLSKFDEALNERGIIFVAMEADRNDTSNATLSQSNQKSKNALSGSDKLADDKRKQPETPQDFVKEFETRLNEMKQKKEQVNERILKLIQSADAGNQEFLSNIDKQGYKLVEQPVEITNWTYGHNPQRYLHQKVVKLKGVIDANIREMRNPADNLSENSILELNGHAMEENVVRQMGAPSAITTYRQFSVWLQTQFRGRKSVRQIAPEEANKCASLMQEYSHVQGIFRTDIGAVDTMIRAMATHVRPQLSSTGIDGVMKQKLLKRTDRMNKLISMYLSSIVMTYRLHTEFILNRRALMRRLYQKN